MKRQVQYPGIRKWSGNDLIELQSESLSVADDFFSQYGSCIVCGCELSGGFISSGLVSIDGMVMPLQKTEVSVTPVYLVAEEEHVQREYADDVVRDIAVRHYAKVVSSKPSGECEHIEVSDSGGRRFFDLVESSWKTEILEKLTDLDSNDTTLSDAIRLLQKGNTDAGERITSIEKRMPSMLDHSPTVTDDGYDIGTEVWTVSENGEKTFWKCHDNAKGAAVWHESGSGGSGSHSGAVYLTGQTDISKASILINKGYLS